jgi:hypothetical protein
MAIKVVVGSSPQRSVTTVLEGEKKPLITPDSVTLGVDTVGKYVATLEAGNGIVLYPEDANTRNAETSNIVVVHAITTSEVSTNNDVLSLIRNVEIDEFGHIILFDNTSFDPTNFFAANGVISTYAITLGNTVINNSGNTFVIEGLDSIKTGDFTIANTTIASAGDITLQSVANGTIFVSGSRITEVGTPTANTDAVPKIYVDTALDNLEEGLLFVADPQNPNDATNKRYVDNLVSGLNVKPAAKAATTADLGGVFNVGNTTFAATITLSPMSVLNVDGVTSWVSGDNILVKDQTDLRQNGTYDIIQIGNAFTPWIIQRSAYADESFEMPGSFEFVTDGTINRNKAYVATVIDKETFVINQDNVVWTQFFGEGNVTAGKDLTLVNGRDFNLNSNVSLETITSLDLETLRIVSNTVFLDSTGAIVIPVGTTDERPTNIRGMIRYNTTDGQFEGYDGTAWSGLGGVVDVDQDTFIRAESSAGADEDQLQFYSNGALRATIDSDGSAVFLGRLIVPVGDTSERYPTGRQGSIRFNTNDNAFEGFDGSNWGTLGGVKDADQDTFIQAETSSGADTDRLDFFTAGTKRLEIRNDGEFAFGDGQNKLTIEYDTGNTAIAGKLTINQNTILGDGQVATFGLTGAIKVPAGTTLQRPPEQSGMIRFNVDDGRFEGYDGSQWAGLAGSVIDVDQDTKIVAESSPNADNDQLQFTTAGTLRFTIEANGVITTPPAADLVFNPSGNINVSNNIITGVASPVNPEDAVNLDYLSNAFSSDLTIKDGANTHAISLLNNPTMTLGRGLEVQNANTTAFNLAIDKSGVQPGIYGNDNFVPRVRVTEDGRIDFATEVPIEIVANAVPDFTETTMDIIGLMMRDGTHVGIEIEYDDANDVFNFSHVNTSDVANTQNEGGNFVRNLSFDDFGHVLDIVSANTDNIYLRLDGAVHAANTIVAPRFADSANTEYYLDPFETSRINNLILGYGRPLSFIEMSDGAGPGDKSFIYATGGEIGFVDNSLNFFAKANRTTGDFTVTGNLIAGGFADSQNTNYVINPAALSNVLNLDVEGRGWFGYNIIIDQSGISANNGIVDLNSNIIRGLATPTQTTDAVNLGYLQNNILGGQGINLSNTFTIDVNVDDTTIEINSDTLRVKSGGITNDKIATPFIKIVGETNPLVPSSFVSATVTLFDGSDWIVNGSIRANTFSFATEPDLHVFVGDTLNFINNGPDTTELYVKTAITSGNTDLATGATNQGANEGGTLTFVPDAAGTFYYVDGNDTGRAGQIIVSDPFTPDEFVYLGETINFVAGEGINTIVSNNTVTISAELATAYASNDNRGIAAFANADFVVSNGVVELANTGVTPGTYGSSTAIPILTVDEHGLITLANTASVAGVEDFTYESSNNTISLETGDGSVFNLRIDEFTGPFTVNGDIIVTGLVDGRDIAADGATLDTLSSATTTLNISGKVTGSAVSNNGVIDVVTELANTGVVANTYGSTTEIPVITIDEDGRITSANIAEIVTTLTVTLEGDVTGSITSSNGNLTIETDVANTGVTAGTYGSSTAIPILTIDADGRISLANTAAVAGVDDFAYDPANNTITLITGDGSVFHLQTQTTINLLGDVTGTATSSNGTVEFTTDIANSGVVAGTYGTASQIPIVTVGLDGRITAMSNTAVAGVDDFFYTSSNNTLHIETGDGSEFLAKINQFGETITVNGDIIVSGNVDGRDVFADGAKLDGIESGAQVNPSNTEILEGLKTVDGAGSGLDADLLDGQHASDIIAAAVNGAGANVGNGRIDIQTGDGLDGSGTFNLNDFTNTSITISHSDTSSVANVSLTDGNVLTGLQFDEFGHVQTTASANLDIRYFNLTGDVVTGNTTFEQNVIIDGTINRNPRITLNGFVNGFTDLVNLANGSMFTSSDTEIFAGAGLTGGGSINANVTISHANTSDVANVVGVATKEVINEVTFDQFGHVVSANTKVLDFITQAEADVRYVNETGDTMTGNLEVQAVISQDHSAFFSESVTTTTTSPFIIFAFNPADFDSGEITITAIRGINRHITKMLVVHNGSDVYATEYGAVFTSAELSSYDVAMVSGEGRVYSTATSATSTEFKVFATMIKS